MIKDIKHLSYTERLESLGLSSLTMKDLRQTFKIIKGMDNVDKGLFFEFDSGGRRAIGHAELSSINLGYS